MPIIRDSSRPYLVVSYILADLLAYRQVRPHNWLERGMFSRGRARVNAVLFAVKRKTRRTNVWTWNARTGHNPCDRSAYFGPMKLPQIGSGLGKAIRDFRKGVSSDDPEDATKETSKDLPR